jgi:hypothetical protein
MLPGAASFFPTDEADVALVTLSSRVAVVVVLSALISTLLAITIVASICKE